MFPHIYFSKVIVSIIIYLLYYIIRITCVEEYNKYIMNFKFCNEWVSTFQINSNKTFNTSDFNDNTNFEFQYLEYIYVNIFKNIYTTFQKLKYDEFFNLFKDIRGDFRYELFPEKKIKNIYIQWYDRSVNPLAFYLFPKLVKYIHDIPISYCCKLILIYPHKKIKFPKIHFNGFVNSFLPIITRNFCLHACWLVR